MHTYTHTQDTVVEEEIDQLTAAAAFKKDEDKHIMAIRNLKLLGVESRPAPEKPKGMITSALNKVCVCVCVCVCVHACILIHSYIYAYVPFPFLKGADGPKNRNKAQDVN